MPFLPHPAQAAIEILSHAEGRVACVPPRKRVALVGFATNTLHLVPWTDPTYEIWGLNQAHQHFQRRADRWFEMHMPEYTEDVRDPAYLQFLRECPVPVYMIERRPDIPNSVRFPIEAATQLAGRDYFTSSIPYMIAIALMDGFEEIGIYGVNLAIGEEYFYQKACAEWWIGLAEGKGVRVYVPSASALLKQHARYGYAQESTPHALTKAMLNGRIGHYRGKCEELLRDYHVQLGAMREAEALLQTAEGLEHGADIISIQPAQSRGT